MSVTCLLSGQEKSSSGVPGVSCLWRRHRLRLHLPPHGEDHRRLQQDGQARVCHLPIASGANFSDEIHCKVCFRWLLLLWNRTTPSCRLTPASSPLTSVSLWTTRLDSMKVFMVYHGFHLAGHLRDLQEEPPSGQANLHQPQSHHRAGEGGSNVNTWKTAPQR